MLIILCWMRAFQKIDQISHNTITCSIKYIISCPVMFSRWLGNTVSSRQMLKAELKRCDSRAAVLEETLMLPDLRPNYFLPSSLLVESRPERLNQLFAYLLLLCKYFGFFWPCLQSNFHLFFFNPIVLEVSLKSIQTNKRGKWHNPCRHFGSHVDLEAAAAVNSFVM